MKIAKLLFKIVKGPSPWCQFLQQLKALFLKLPKIGKSKKNIMVLEIWTGI